MTKLEVLNRKLAMLASLTGNDPLPFSYKTKGLDCNDLSCHECPFTIWGESPEDPGSCDVPDRKSKALENATIRTYKDAIANYPEYFL